jgi:hypothetical protein
LCNAQKATLGSNKIPNGKWICVQDSFSSIVVSDVYVYEFYNSVPIDTTKYLLSKHTCDASYKSIKKEALFLVLHKDLCYEVEGITEHYLELTYTANGKTITYYKQER